jgi:site-specific DNA-methyltransferase (adenine-specific)
MNKKWDYDVPSKEIWTECLRVLKPGGHMLSFGGSRTYHRMAVSVEDAGFEIRDQIIFVYGSGFPKSHNIGKAIDKIEGNEREVVGTKERKDFKNYDGSMMNVDNRGKHIKIDVEETKGNSEWEGWGTALKPAHEDIVLAKKDGEDLMDVDTQPGFFYGSKANKKDRNEGLTGITNQHPTVKNVELMKYLIKLITPPNGVVLDPFMGSGSTGKAAVQLGHSFIGIEREKEYFDIAQARINHEKSKPVQGKLL